MFFFFSSRRRHTRCGRDWSSDVCSSDLQLVLERHDRLEATRVSLPAAAAEQLAVDSPGLMKLGCDHVQPAGPFDLPPKANVGPAAGHVRGHGKPTGLAGLRDDLGLLLVLSRIE